MVILLLWIIKLHNTTFTGCKSYNYTTIIMSSEKGQNKGKPSNEQKPGQKDPKVGASSSHTVQGAAKRKLEQVANSSAEELVLLNTQMEELSGDIKLIKNNMDGLMQKSSEMMTKADMKAFIRGTVEEIMIEINKSIELTIETKIKEKTKSLKKDVDQLTKDVESLRNENNKLKKDLSQAEKKNSEIEKIAKQGQTTANQNEQYSRKTNVKILDIKKEGNEDESTLTTTVSNLLATQGVMIRPESILAIHRIPSKPGTVNPVLVKFRNNNDKTKVMKIRAEMKAAGHRLVDDVTKLNTALITKLNDHASIESAWYFNGSIYGKTDSGKRLRFDIHDDIDTVISNANSKK